MRRSPRRRSSVAVTPELVAQVHELLNNTRYTQDEIAMQLGCSQATVSRLSRLTPDGSIAQ
jgi:predicted XRE-type DNA-binding protein